MTTSSAEQESGAEGADLDGWSWLDYLAFELGEPQARRIALELWGAADLDGAARALSLEAGVRHLEDAGLGLGGYFLHCQVFALHAWAPGIPDCWRRESDWWWAELE